MRETSFIFKTARNGEMKQHIMSLMIWHKQADQGDAQLESGPGHNWPVLGIARISILFERIECSSGRAAAFC